MFNNNYGGFLNSYIPYNIKQIDNTVINYDNISNTDYLEKLGTVYSNKLNLDNIIPTIDQKKLSDLIDTEKNTIRDLIISIQDKRLNNYIIDNKLLIKDEKKYNILKVILKEHHDNYKNIIAEREKLK